MFSETKVTSSLQVPCIALMVKLYLKTEMNPLSIVISVRTLKRLYENGLCSGRLHLCKPEMEANGKTQVYPWLHLHAIQRGYVVSQDTIRQLLMLFDPEAVMFRQLQSLTELCFNIILDILSLFLIFLLFFSLIA